jgi:hypothetical protein
MIPWLQIDRVPGVGEEFTIDLGRKVMGLE